MNYEKLYKEAIERAKQHCADYVVETIFTELKESGDEKTKRILHSISNKINLHLSDIFTEEEFQCFDTWSNAWLERQKSCEPFSNGEDERIKEWLINLVKDHVERMKGRIGEQLYNGLLHGRELEKAKEALAWLEKQGEHEFVLKHTWSEEDEKKIRALLSICDVYSTKTSFYPKENKDIEILKDWLKSLRPQTTWKPSEEQMKALANALSLAKNCGEESAFELRTMYEHLKKL